MRGEEYSICSSDAKSNVLRATTLTGTVKLTLDTPILTEDGALTVESEGLAESLGVKLLEG